jgi:hypothetical protein
MTIESIDRAKRYSEAKLEKIRAALDGLVPPGEVVLTCGSYARREASPHSDIDFFIITSNAADEPGRAIAVPWLGPATEAIARIVEVAPADDGAFGAIEPRDALLQNIGGANDSNHNITRRMLMLLEGEWLFNSEGLNQLRRQILERYIGEAMTDHQLALFLLNDVIRYYRTMCVDYEFKTNEGEKPKPWGIRNIKLVFSRKLLYASGLFSVAMTADRARNQKIEILERLFGLAVLDRMVAICGQEEMQGVLKSYAYFLERLEHAHVRERLRKLALHERADPLFRELKNEGHHLTRELLKLFEATFDSTHPIHRAVIF